MKLGWLVILLGAWLAPLSSMAEPTKGATKAVTSIDSGTKKVTGTVGKAADRVTKGSKKVNTVIKKNRAKVIAKINEGKKRIKGVRTQVDKVRKSVVDTPKQITKAAKDALGNTKKALDFSGVKKAFSGLGGMFKLK